MANTCDEIFNKLKLFIKSPNSVHNVGEEREKWVPNPKANSLTDLDNFYRLGVLLCLALRITECLEVNLPTMFWKYLLGSFCSQGAKLEWEDYKNLNLNQYVCLEKIKSMSEDELEYLEEHFTTFLPDGKEYELEVGGKDRSLTVSNRMEYIEKTKKTHLAYLEKTFGMMRRGFREYLHPYRFYMNGPSDLEKMICGMNYVNTLLYRSTFRSSNRSLTTKASATTKKTILR